ncbi:hypothetical protein SLEP1_g56175 [Rubroshorea leprosula]|uniref:Steroid 5-alpha reductase C-terminal domain-containing protein n=1 Tax=Rubroshorea leprosula TaxID=152421 RepID=A0AAV5MIT3_9ROSI|nr:hypothetical protein SLEP1_g56175 [Rubroshorea leprosula]
MNLGFSLWVVKWVLVCLLCVSLHDSDQKKMGRNLTNAVIGILVPLPSILFYLSFLNHFDRNSTSPLWSWCFHHPLLLANLFFFFNVNVLFWVISHFQSSHWMIDLYWTVIPVLLAHYYATHPLAQYNSWRSIIVILLTWVFSIGVCLPLYAVHVVDKPLNVWHFVAAAVCLCGIVIAYFADTQLHDFVTRNQKLKELGKPLAANLERGLWQYSRHPNYFGEQLWWWGLVLFAGNLGHGWTFIGSLINSMCLVYVTVLVEQRMLKQDYRAEAYRIYQKTTSAWIPWFKSSAIAVKNKST